MFALIALFAARPDWFPLAPNDGVVRELALLFALGSLAYVWRDAVPVSLIGAAVAVLLVAWNPGGWPRGALFAPLLAYVVLVAAYHPRLVWPPFNRAGDYSYGVYVYSFPVQQTLMQRWPGLEPAGLFALSLPLVLAVAALSWHATRAARARLKITFHRNPGITMTAPKTLREASCADDYDPNSMAVDQARALIRQFLTPVTAIERVHVRFALNRVLAEDIISPIAVPGHDNSAMDGWAVRFADLKSGEETALTKVGESFAGKPHHGAIGPGEAVRIFTGGVMPAGADTVVMQERAQEVAGGVRIAAGAVTKAGQNRRFAGEDLKQGQVVFRSGQHVHPAELGMIASLGINEVGVYRKLRVTFFSTGDELKSIGTPLAEGEIYDSNRYTLYGMLTRLGCEIVDMGVVPDVPDELERAFATAAANADVVITSGGVSVGEADYVKQLLDKLGEVLFWKIAMKPGRPLAYGRVGAAHFFGLPGQSGLGDGDVLSVRSRRAADIARAARRHARADVQGDVGCADPQGARTHRIPARHPRAGQRRRLDRAHDGRSGLRHPVVDVAGELLHRAWNRNRQCRGRRERRRAIARRLALTARRA